MVTISYSRNGFLSNGEARLWRSVAPEHRRCSFRFDSGSQPSAPEDFIAAYTLQKLAGFTNDPRYVEIAHQALAQRESMIAQYPLGFGQWLAALGYAMSRPREIAIIGKPEAPDTAGLLGIA